MTIKNATRTTYTETYPVKGYGRAAKIRWQVQMHRIGDQAAYFSITGEVRNPWRHDILAGGCIHDFGGVALAGKDKLLPELVRWHLTGLDGPMHYEANSLYHFEQGNLDYFRRSCVFGAVDGDVMPTTVSEARTFLRARFDALMVAFERDMIRWFGADIAE